ncbi:MAG: hypothetical protein AABZ31_01500 [Bdellovibrionota bacterium]
MKNLLVCLAALAFLPPVASASTVACDLIGENDEHVRLTPVVAAKGTLAGKLGAYEATVVLSERGDTKIVELRIEDRSTGNIATTRSQVKGLRKSKNSSVTVSTSLETPEGVNYSDVICVIK